jgi:hypothetical protein
MATAQVKYTNRVPPRVKLITTKLATTKLATTKLATMKVATTKLATMKVATTKLATMKVATTKLATMKNDGTRIFIVTLFTIIEGNGANFMGSITIASGNGITVLRGHPIMHIGAAVFGDP